MREVVMIDIANDPIQPADYKPHEDPTKFHSAKTGRGPLIGKWQDTVRSDNNRQQSLGGLSLFRVVERSPWRLSSIAYVFLIVFHPYHGLAGEAGHDVLQASHGRVQVVWSPDPSGELHHEGREASLHQLPPVLFFFSFIIAWFARVGLVNSGPPFELNPKIFLLMSQCFNHQ